jgi:hypothetical protein
MVLEIRRLRPDVIITNHSVTSNDHGHHQATARLELEAFDASADPKRFPEQLKDGIAVWQVQRLFVRVRGNAQAQADTSPVVTIDPNEQDPIRGVVYAEEALRALQKHATQGPWPKTFAEFAARFRAFTGQSAAPGQLPLIRYRLVREAKGLDVLPKDSRNFLDGLKLPEEFVKELEMPSIDHRPLAESDDRSKVLAELIKYSSKGYRFTSDRSDYQRLYFMRDRIDRATAIAAGIVVRAEPSNSVVTPNSIIDLKVNISNTGSQTLYGLDCGSKIPGLEEPPRPSKNFGGPTSIFTTYTELKGGATLTKDETVKISGNASINLPLASHLYEPSALGLQLVTRCSVSFGPARINGFNLTSTMALNVAPPVEITSISPSLVVITPQTGNIARTLTLQVSNRGKVGVHTSIEAIAAADNPERKRNRVNETPLTMRPEETRELKITLPMKLTIEPRTIVRRTVLVSGSSPAIIEPPTPAAPDPRFLFRTVDKSSNEVSVPLVYADAHVTPKLNVGYIRGFDYSLPNALNALGVESKELSVDEVKTADLQKYSAIIVDNRVYESQPALIGANQKLLDFANAGGTLIVFYHKSDEWNPDPRRNRPQLAPYKLILGNERITDENAPVTFIEPQHPLLNVPNKMGQEDFTGWIQERGLYYPREWDPQFHALLQSNDPGEVPLKGGLIVADYGRGHYIYSSMVWYRQLRAGVPGAYRMLANMISYGHR